MTSNELRWGLLCTANINRRLIPAIRAADRNVLVAVASRSPERAKAYAADVAMKVTVDALQILGGHGYTQEHPLERMLRDAKLFAIGEGTTQIQKLIIARELINR